jgi:hypothetical protein
MNPELPLRDIHLPGEPSWWPPAPGWWLLAVIVLALLFLALRWGLRRWRARRRLRALQSEFDQAAAINDPRACLIAVSELLRRAARGCNPAAATLSGADWIGFLDRHSGADTGAVFSSELGQLLLDGAYRPKVDAEAVRSLLGPARQCFLNLVRAP